MPKSVIMEIHSQVCHRTITVSCIGTMYGVQVAWEMIISTTWVGACGSGITPACCHCLCTLDRQWKDEPHECDRWRSAMSTKSNRFGHFVDVCSILNRWHHHHFTHRRYFTPFVLRYALLLISLYCKKWGIVEVGTGWSGAQRDGRCVCLC